MLFIPERGRGASGELQPDGTFTLTTFSTGDGAVVGKHRVAIDTRTFKHTASVENEKPPGKSLIPEQYGDEARSGLTFDVKSGQDNRADFELHSH